MESKQPKGAKICENFCCQREGDKMIKTFSKIFERQNMQNQIISELYTELH